MITSRSVDGGIQGTERCPKSPAGKEQYRVLSSDRLAQFVLFPPRRVLLFGFTCISACIFMSYVWEAERKVWESVFHYIPLCTFGLCEVLSINIFKPIYLNIYL